MKAPSKKPNLSPYERYLLSALAYGVPVGKLPVILEFYSIEANSIGIVDKHLRSLRKKFNCKTNTQLVYELRNRVVALDLEGIGLRTLGFENPE
ncbi:hypothetical protein ACFSYG_04705 [Leeuwenhoekiella polynyae]|uniref:Transcriptional regulator n=1 Tax=Leeuwenhoekiella polynyae TaxID=1550906 RepID=A0A4Q0P0Z2_9FLAO|nr:hypothetical protein [Leeuwenhoekiella polynyae]RXG20047.1 hypothetical protein DSM02_2698 [Leeuwenhoekiella polynyae]